MINGTEEWRPVAGYEGLYEVSSAGRVRRVKAATNTTVGRVLKPTWGGCGYLMVNLSNGKARMRLVHRLVCQAFHGPPPSERHEVAHGDGDRSNNSAGNLRWSTTADNHADKRRHGTVLTGDRHPGVKHSDADIARMFERRAAGALIDQIAREFDTNRAHVQAILKRRVRATAPVSPTLLAAAAATDGRRKPR